MRDWTCSIVFKDNSKKANALLKQILTRQDCSLGDYEVILEDYGEKEELSSVFDNIKQWDVDILSVGIHKNVINEIKDIKFNKLTYLGINSSQVQSVESLNLMKMPEIKTLFFSIYQFQKRPKYNFQNTALEKIKSSKINKYLHVVSNMIQDYEVLVHLQSKKLYALGIDSIDQEIKQNQNIKWLMKTGFQTLTELFIRRGRDIEISQLFSIALENKYALVINPEN